MDAKPWEVPRAALGMTMTEEMEAVAICHPEERERRKGLRRG
jgi:hypothetical protein